MAESIIESSEETVLNVAKTERIRVLHVDDDPAFLKVAKQCLDTQGEFEVDTASSVNEAFEKLKKKEYDVVVSDYQMPNKDGLEFLSELREKGNTAAFIVFTGKSREEVAVKALNLGADRYFGKFGQPETVYGELAHGIKTTVNFRKAGQASKESGEKYRSLFENMLNGFAYCRMMFDEKDKPVDFVYLDVNDAFEKLTGLKKEDVVGKKVTEAIPGIEKAHPELFDIYGRVALTGKEEKFEIFLKPLNIWLSILVYSPKKGYFVAVFENITERKKAEEALRRSEEQAKLLLEFQNKVIDTAIVWINLLDKEGNVILWNRAAELVSGYSREEVLGHKKIWEWLYPDPKYHAEAFSHAKELIEKRGRSEGFKSTIRCKDGTLKTISWYDNSILDENGKPVSYIAIGMDVTERKKMEEEIKSLARFPSENPNPVLRISQDSRILFANDAGKALLKKLNCEVDGSVPTFLKNLAVETLKSKSRRSEESEIYGRIYEFYAMPIVDKGYVNVYGIDITERKRAIEEIRKSSEEWKKTFDSISDLMFILDTNFRFARVNKATCDALKKEPNELIGKRCFEVLHGTDKPWPNCPYKKTSVTKEATTEEVSDPNIGFPLLVTVSPIFDDKGEFCGVVHVAKDITKLKGAEERLKEINKRLAVTNEKLHVVGSLTRHDVRNKLSAVTGNAYLLRRKLAEDPKALEQLKDIEAAVRQVEQIFEFAGTYEKLGVEQLVNVDVGEAVDGAALLFLDLKNVRIANECSGLTVLADSLLRQLFYNLIDNSLKCGERTRQIQIYYRTPDADQLELVYEDDGVGIPNNMRSNLFKEGFSSGKGAGYGLFMIKRICEVHGWTIQETGKQGTGAQFTILIPRIGSTGKANYQIQKPRQH